VVERSSTGADIWFLLIVPYASFGVADRWGNGGGADPSSFFALLEVVKARARDIFAEWDVWPDRNNYFFQRDWWGLPGSR
jgi:hypothetical protein